MMPKYFWAREETELLKRLRVQEGRDWDDIGIALKRSGIACKTKFNKMMSGDRRERAPRRPMIRDPYNTESLPDRFADRDARERAAFLRTPTQAFFGDPPPGYSALDHARRSFSPVASVRQTEILKEE